MAAIASSREVQSPSPTTENKENRAPSPQNRRSSVAYKAVVMTTASFGNSILKRNPGLTNVMEVSKKALAQTKTGEPVQFSSQPQVQALAPVASRVLKPLATTCLAQARHAALVTNSAAPVMPMAQSAPNGAVEALKSQHVSVAPIAQNVVAPAGAMMTATVSAAANGSVPVLGSQAAATPPAQNAVSQPAVNGSAPALGSQQGAASPSAACASGAASPTASSSPQSISLQFGSGACVLNDEDLSPMSQSSAAGNHHPFTPFDLSRVSGVPILDMPPEFPMNDLMSAPQETLLSAPLSPQQLNLMRSMSQPEPQSQAASAAAEVDNERESLYVYTRNLRWAVADHNLELARRYQRKIKLEHGVDVSISSSRSATPDIRGRRHEATGIEDQNQPNTDENTLRAKVLLGQSTVALNARLDKMQSK